MNVVGIAAEYNPFHKGHQFHIEQTKALCGSDALILCVMSGDFVQRGEAAVYDKFVRAESACRSGADLVFELPLPWCLSSAEGFARGAVSLIEALGCSHISFGSEAGELDALSGLADLLCSEHFNDDVRRVLTEHPNLSYAAARQQAAEEILGERAKHLEQPNNILAIEYLKAIKERDSSLIPVTVARTGSCHDGSGGEMPSAAEIRAKLRRGENIDDLIPAQALAVYKKAEASGRGKPSEELLETAVMARLRALKPEDLELLPDAGDGLGLRLYRCLEEADIDAILAAAKTKRYAMSRLRRLLCCAALGVQNGMTDADPPYARLLAANARGCEHLKTLRGTAVPVLTRAAVVRGMDERTEAIFELGARAHDLYVLGRADRNARRGGEDWRTGPCIL